MNTNITGKRNLSKKLIVLVLSLVLMATAIFGITMASQNAMTVASYFNATVSETIVNNLIRENCSDSSIMQHARPIDHGREFYLDRIDVILKHRYSINQNVNQSMLVNQTQDVASRMRVNAVAMNLSEVMVDGWICSQEALGNGMINHEQFNQILEIRLDIPSVQAVVDAVALWNSSPMVLTALPVYKCEPISYDEDFFGFEPFNAANLRWALDMINAPAAQGITLGQGVNVGIMNSNRVFNHSTFMHNGVSRFRGGPNTGSVADNPTSQAGIIGGSHTNFGIAPRVHLYSLPTSNNFRDGINFAIDNNIRVITTSFGFNCPCCGRGSSNATRQANINRFNGVFVAASGNYTQNLNTNPRFPATDTQHGMKSLLYQEDFQKHWECYNLQVKTVSCLMS